MNKNLLIELSLVVACLGYGFFMGRYAHFSFPVNKITKSIKQVHELNYYSVQKTKKTLLNKFKVEKLVLTDKNSITLDSEINETSVSQTISAINTLNKSGSGPIYLDIDSPGGSVFAGFRLIGVMKYSRRPIYTICTEICASMAAYIHQFGKKRFMADESVLMFHDAFGQFNGNIRQQLSALALISHMLNQLDRHIAKQTHEKLSDFQARVQSKNLWLDSEEATREYFSDGIVNVINKDSQNLISDTSATNKENLPYKVKDDKTIINFIHNTRM